MPQEKLTYCNTPGEGGVSEMGDPHVFWDDATQKWYMTGTVNGIPQGGFKIFSSEDLTSWDTGKIIFLKEDVAWGHNGLWGAEIHKVNGRYQLYYSVWAMDGEGKPTSPRIGVAFCDRVDGRYTDSGKPLIDFGYSVIDNHLFTDVDGTRYLCFVRDALDLVVNGVHESHIYIVELNEDATAVRPGAVPVPLLKPDLEWERRSGKGEWAWTEGCWMQRMDNGRYYLFYSANKFCSHHYCIGYAVSDSPKGPFVKSPEPLLSTFSETLAGPGNNSIFRSKDGKELFTAYHMLTTPEAPSGNRYLNVDRIGLRADGTLFVNAPTCTPQPLPSGEKEGHTLLSDSATVLADGTNPQALTDGEITMRSLDATREWSAAKRPEEAVVRLAWDREICVRSVFLYASVLQERRPASLTVRFSNGSIFTDLPVGSTAGEATTVCTDGIRTRWIEISVCRTAPEQTGFALSEVLVFGDANERK